MLKRGDKAMVTARNIDSIKKIAELGASRIQLDVTASQEIINARIKGAAAAYGRIDVLVRSAGHGMSDSVEKLIANGGME